MSEPSGFKYKFERLKATIHRLLIAPVKAFLSRIKYPGKDNLSLLDIGSFFITGLKKGDIRARAKSISFDFFLAVFPAIIFFFTLIPYLPMPGIQDRLLLLIQEVLPPNTFEAARTTIEDILKQPHSGLLSFGFIFALYISANGIYSMIDGFNKSYHGIEVRTPFKQRMISVFLTLMLAIILIGSFALIGFTEYAVANLEGKAILNNATTVLMLRTGTTAILLMTSLMMISSLYFFGPSKKNRRPFISVGSVTTTIMITLTTFAFNYFIGNFSQYNKLYGSIGTLIIILVWINFIAVQLIIGFELNASIENAKINAAANEEKIRRTI